VLGVVIDQLSLNAVMGILNSVHKRCNVELLRGVLIFLFFFLLGVAIFI